MKQSKSITLVALVLTIIVLLILAGISIQAMTNTGLFASASQAKKEAKRGQIEEWLNLKLIEEQMYNPTGTAEEIIEATRVASDGNTYTLRDAVNNSYIEALVLCASTNGSYSQYIWTSIMGIIDGGTSGTANYPCANIFFKVKDKSVFTGISFNTNKDWNTTYDGVKAYKIKENFELSTQPLE